MTTGRLLLTLEHPAQARRSALQNALPSLLVRAPQTSLRVRPPVDSTSGRLHRARMSAHACLPCSHSSRRSVPFKGCRHVHAMIDALSTAPQRAGEAADEWCWPSALVGGGAALGESVDACASAAGARLGCGDGGAAATSLGCWSRECGGSRRLSRAGQGGVCGRVQRSACEDGTGSPGGLCGRRVNLGCAEGRSGRVRA